MGLFDFLKSKESKYSEGMARMDATIFPKGEKDVNAATSELLHILNNKVSRNDAKNIVLKSIAISYLSDPFTRERLKKHLERYCIQHFNNMQIDKFYKYLIALTLARGINQRTPSEVCRDGDEYYW